MEEEKIIRKCEYATEVINGVKKYFCARKEEGCIYGHEIKKVDKNVYLANVCPVNGEAREKEGRLVSEVSL